ncbi:MAG: S8 family peptidase, partial [Bacteroidetes bacterium]|nr:S8 family peptidase [Bacteroidota bacterium]
TLRTILTLDSVAADKREGYLLMYTQGTGNMNQRFKVLDDQGNVIATTRNYSTALAGMFSGLDTVSWQAGDTLFINADVPRNAILHSTGWGYMGFIATLKSDNPVLYVATHVIRTTTNSTIPHVWGGYGAGGRALVDTLPGSSTPLPGYQAGDTQYTITETGGTGRRTISVGNLTARTHFTNIKGEEVANDTSDGGKGSLAHSSSKGPTLDQRVKPDLVATGNSLIAPYSRVHLPIDSAVVVYGFEVDNETRYMGNMWGTSMASPCVTGAVALMLQARPGMDYTQAVNLLRMTATADGFTGAVPNLHYGYGKLNVFEAVMAAQLSVNRDNRLQEARLAVLYPNPGIGSPRLRLLHTQGSALQLQVMDLRGRVLHTQTATPATPDATVQVNMGGLPAGLYLIRLQQGNWVQSLRYQKVQ